MMIQTNGKVYLVGAGCGKADLITMRGQELLKQCDAVVYDDLIDPDLLTLLPKGAEQIYMGKRSGKDYASQEQINETLISLASEGKTVVRLKGGDPFIFGRGGEEILALQAAGISYDEVPGITSAIAIPAAAGIPVTHRKLSRSVHIITAHTSDSADGLPSDFPYLARLDGTLVFLMGLSRLSLIAERLMKEGMSPDTPCAVLSGGNSPNPAAVRGCLKNICLRADAAKVLPPAVIVVGPTAAMDLSPSVQLPLTGKHIGITGTASIAGKQRTALSGLGAAVHVCGVTDLVELPFDFPLSRLGDSDRKLIVFTSGNGIRLFFRHLRDAKFDLRRLASATFAVIGRASAEVLEEYGIYAEICPTVFTSEALADEILHRWDGGDVLIFRSADGSRILKEKLETCYPVFDTALYTVAAAETAVSLPDHLDYLTFSSASGVRLFFEQGNSIPDSCIPVCIGEVTQKELMQYSAALPLLASECTVDGIVKVICEHASAN